MSETTDRLKLPLIASGQAQKEMTHNEALALMDIAVQPVVQAMEMGAPPETPVAGQCWIVGPAPSGAWAGQAGAIAGWSQAGWRFAVPQRGWSAWLEVEGRIVRFDGEVWSGEVARIESVEIGGTRVVAAQQPALELNSGGTVIDSEAREAISQILARLRAHGLIAG